VSFDEDQVVTRMVRSKGSVSVSSVYTDRINVDAKLQSKLDERGAHDFLSERPLFSAKEKKRQLRYPCWVREGKRRLRREVSQRNAVRQCQRHTGFRRNLESIGDPLVCID